ncbi:hypothetical protein SUGI_1011820 [Cryptomeria japonica]|nr:hypothetical protein SUGI_1011820 [Cryptomeria japonica]
MQFYFHDKVSGQNVTAVEVTHSPSTKSSPTFFRSVVVIDDLLTEGLEPTSKLLGRAQGLVGNLTAAHWPWWVTTQCLMRLGRCGMFRMARGYALAHTHSFDIKAGNAIVHYSVTVLHY